jgi:hypothetical protein
MYDEINASRGQDSNMFRLDSDCNLFIADFRVSSTGIPAGRKIYTRTGKGTVLPAKLHLPAGLEVSWSFKLAWSLY